MSSITDPSDVAECLHTVEQLHIFEHHRHECCSLQTVDTGFRRQPQNGIPRMRSVLVLLSLFKKAG